MKITVFGATGRTGREVVSQALAANHDVTVLVRNPGKLGNLADRLTVVPGDTGDANTVDRAVAGAEAVLSVLGHAQGSADDVLSTAAANMVAAMRRHGIARLIVLGNTAVRDPHDQPKLFQRLITGYLGMVKAGLMRDHSAQARVVADSGLDWTIVRAARLAEGPRASQYRVGLLGPDTGTVTHGDVAAYMLALAANREQVRAMPLISA
jgi:putative NADH-flavin reductase